MIKGFFLQAKIDFSVVMLLKNVSKSDYDRAISGDRQTTIAEAMKRNIHSLIYKQRQ
uniref:Uncharacterized protein n=1 Tax=Klebsiella pneumoniae TaxID=573 RepID=A0A8B0ST53_KLEPN|nr:hypothetical protein [Klebsiella pneumoniae]